MIAPIAPRESKRQCERDELHRQANAMNFGSLLHVAVGLQAKALALLLLWLLLRPFVGACLQAKALALALALALLLLWLLLWLFVGACLQAKALALLLLWLRIKHRQPRSFRLLLTTHSSALWMRFAELTDPTLTAEGACELLILLLLPSPFARVETRPPART
jgi:hypothetical protein